MSLTCPSSETFTRQEQCEVFIRSMISPEKNANVENLNILVTCKSAHGCQMSKTEVGA